MEAEEKMTAEEIFKSHGYEKTIDNFGVHYNTRGIFKSSVYFETSTKKVHFSDYDNWDNRCMGFTLSKRQYDILEAVQKQLEELGW